MQKDCLEKLDESQSRCIPGIYCVADFFIIERLIEKQISPNHSIVYRKHMIQYSVVLWNVIADLERY